MRRACLILCLLLLGGSVVLWVWSYRRSCQIGRWSLSVQGGAVIEVCSGVFAHEGTIAWADSSYTESIPYHLKYYPALPATFSRSGWISDAPTWPYGLLDGHTFLGFHCHINGGVGDGGNDSVQRMSSISIPLWFPTVVSGLLSLWLRRRARRNPAGRGFPVEPPPPPA